MITLRVLGGAVVLVCLLCFTPVPEGVAKLVRTEPHLDRADAIVVLSGGVYADGKLKLPSLSRAIHGVVLYRKGLAPVIVFSRAGRPPDAYARLAQDLGVPAEAVVSNPGGRTTREEALTLATVLAGRVPRRILLVSDAWHLARAAPLFEQAGFDVLPAPPEYSTAVSRPDDRLFLLRDVIREMTARLYYRVARYSG